MQFKTKQILVTYQEDLLRADKHDDRKAWKHNIREKTWEGKEEKREKW